ncbi:GINS complex Sld5 component [Mycena floridula]|nr:GINS complex Sld5 component [Mycena floridula]
MATWLEEFEQSKRTGIPFVNRAKNALLDEDEDDGDIRMAPPAAAPVEDRPFDFLDDPETPLQELIRHWMNERHAPDILPAQEQLLGTLLDHIRRQTDAVQALRGDPSSSEEEHIRIMLVQTEVERVKFIVRSYVCTRLYKIEKYARFIATSPDLQSRITVAERAHASRQAKITENHFHVSVLQSLPESQSYLDDTPIFMPPMVTPPDTSRPVFVRALRDCRPFNLSDGKRMQLQKGQISLTAYSVIEHLVLSGDVELV